jgi:hypothetical protein
MQLTTIDLHSVARAVAGLDSWKELNPSAPVHLMLSNIKDHKDRITLQRLLGEETMREILRIEDPAAPPPMPPAAPNTGLHTIPDLPDHVRLSADQESAASRVGLWEREYTAWAGTMANQTPNLFHQAGALFLGGVAIGRRMFIPATWGEEIFPNFYFMNVAISTFYKKTAALRLAEKTMRAAMPHMLLPEPGSPENFIKLLSNRLPDNYEQMVPEDKTRAEKGTSFAAQRAIIRDELSGLFKSMGKDFMAGMKERVMQMYDCPPLLEFSTNSKGVITVRSVAVSIYGSTTPAELGLALSYTDWSNGLLARFALLTPEPEYAERPEPDAFRANMDLIERLEKLHKLLPQPPSPLGMDVNSPPDAWALASPIWEYVRRYEKALRHMTRADGPLDDRLRGVYGRLHVQALKVAITLCALDWADMGDPGVKPIVTPSYWFRAQQIVETWRASAHRLLFDISQSEDSNTESRILKHLGSYPDGETLYELTNRTKLPRRAIQDALSSLIASGMVKETERKPQRGPTAKAYARCEVE